MATAYLNWAICLVACALFLPFIVRRNPRADVRVLIAASYLGIGTVWHGGLSGSAPLILATPGNPLLAPASGAQLVTRLYPVTETLFSPFNLIYIAVVGAVALLCIIALHPSRGVVTLSAEQIDAILPKPPEERSDAGDTRGRDRPAARLGLARDAAARLRTPTLLGDARLRHDLDDQRLQHRLPAGRASAARPPPALPARLPGRRRCRLGHHPAVPVLRGDLRADAGRAASAAGSASSFASAASAATFPFVVYTYSALMNLFVPSGGSKWLIEAPFLLPAAASLGVSPVTTLLAYSYGDSTTNLIQPFFAIPILSIARMRFGDVVGYTFLVAAACFAVSAIAMFLIPLDL